jgi:hypothetical protein
MRGDSIAFRLGFAALGKIGFRLADNSTAEAELPRHSKARARFEDQ